MKIEQVNENQIRCILTKEDLEERKIKFSELTYGSEKATRLFRDVMQQANYEFGFSPDEHPLMIEAVPMQSGMIVFVITKVTAPDEFDSKLSQIVNALKDNMGGDVIDDEEDLPFGSSDDTEPVTASIRLTPAAADASERMWKSPSFDVLSTCAPPQNSTEKSLALTTRTMSPYFSPNRAIAPIFLASSIGISVDETGIASSIFALTRFSTLLSSSAVIAEKCVKSKRSFSSVTS